MKTRHLKWYHWALLIMCGAGLLSVGVLDLMGGASKESRFYSIDNVLVRLIGAGLLSGAIGLVLRRGWGFAVSILFVALSVAEIIATSGTGSAELLLNAVAALLIFGIPIALLVWFRRAFTLRSAAPTASPNGGPAEVLGNSGASGGPPSVS
jgi:hypothetical protein